MKKVLSFLAIVAIVGTFLISCETEEPKPETLKTEVLTTDGDEDEVKPPQPPARN